MHPFETERKIYKALQKEGLITLHEVAAVGDENRNNPSSDNSDSSSSSSSAHSNSHDEN